MSSLLCSVLGVGYTALAKTPAVTQPQTEEDKPIVLAREDLYTALYELRRQGAAEDEIGECTLQAATLRAPETDKYGMASLADATAKIVREAIAVTVLRKSSKFNLLPESIKKKAVELLAVEIKGVYPEKEITTLYHLLSFPEKLSYLSFCRTQNAWWTPTYGKFPDAVTLKIITGAAITRAIANARAAWAKEIEASAPTEISRKATLINSIQALKGGKAVTSVTEGSTFEVVVAGENLPIGTDAVVNIEGITVSKIVETTASKMKLEVKAGTPDNRTSRKVTLAARRLESTLSLTIVKKAAGTAGGVSPVKKGGVCGGRELPENKEDACNKECGPMTNKPEQNECIEAYILGIK